MICHGSQFGRHRSMYGTLALCWGLAGLAGGADADRGESANPKELVVTATDDFEVDGTGTAAPWQKIEWVPMRLREPASKSDYQARFKVLYSKTGLYVLMDGSDSLITSTMRADYSDLWKEDVFEVFLWTDEAYPLYFEYEISPLGYELPILVPNFNGRQLGWRPWKYDGDRKTRKATSAVGGTIESGAAVRGWTAEVYIPFDLLRPLQNVPPGPGTRWRANFYRVDRDRGVTTTFDWAPVKDGFHEYTRFGTLVFK